MIDREVMVVSADDAGTTIASDVQVVVVVHPDAERAAEAAEVVRAQVSRTAVFVGDLIEDRAALDEFVSELFTARG